MKISVLIFATATALLQTNIAKADEAFLSQVASGFSSAAALSSPSTIAVPVVIGASPVSSPGTNLLKQNIFQVTQRGTNNSSIGTQVGAGNLSLVSQQGIGNKVIINQRNTR
jgi:Curlin associated repeat